MGQTSEFIRCWEFFHCDQTECEVNRTDERRCWLITETHCHGKIQGSCLEKMESCLSCEVFNRNFTEIDWVETFKLISEQFKSYKEEIEIAHADFKENEKRLRDFKMTSVYLLKELAKKGREVEAERDNLEMRVIERTKELMEAQTKLIQSIKMAAIGRFSSGIAHEINNPLGAVINFTRTLLGNPEIKGDDRNHLELILKGLFRIENVVKQVLSYSGKLDSEPRSVDVNQMVHESVDFIQHKLENKGIDLNMELMNKRQTITIDPNQIQQIFMNILNNAIDAMNRDGNLTIKTSSSENWVKIEFIDNGIGISEENLENIFDPFYTTKEVGKGTGLGLFICYSILQIYNGNLEVKSKEGEGTRVIVKCPVPKDE